MRLRIVESSLLLCLLIFVLVGRSAAQSESPNARENNPESTAEDEAGLKRNEGNDAPGVLNKSPLAESVVEQIDELFERWNRTDSPGASVAVVQDGRIIYRHGYGSANLEYDVPNSPTTVFHIASVSKQFTAFAIMLLVDQGKLSLDDDIRKYIPEVPDFGKKITLRHLANHTSGLRDQWALLQMAGWRLDDVITKDHIMKLIRKQEKLNFDPGNEFLYSNTGYTLLAEVVARVSGQTFAEFTQANIFEPLGMDDTIFFDDHQEIVRNRAYSYRRFGRRHKKLVLSYANVGATSLLTTVEDLGLWAVNFEAPVVGNEKIFEAMATRGVLNDGVEIPYALGQIVGKYKGLSLFSHSGGDAGYRSFLARFPDQKFSVIVLSNLGSFDPGSIAYKIADLVLADDFPQDAVRPKPNVAVKVAGKEPEPEAPAKIDVDPKRLNDYTGYYELRPGFAITITQKDGDLFGQATGQGRFQLNAISATRFSATGASAEVSFHQTGGEQWDLLKLHQGGQIHAAPKRIPFDRNAVDLHQFEGRYFSSELSTEYEFLIENGRLMVRHSRHGDVMARPIRNDLFQTGNRLGQVSFIRDHDGTITGCEMSNGRVRHLAFKKIIDHDQ